MFERGSGDLHTSQPISVCGKAKEQILLECIFKDVIVKKKVSSQHRFMKGEMCLTS